MIEMRNMTWPGIAAARRHIAAAVRFVRRALGIAEPFMFQCRKCGGYDIELYTTPGGVIAVRCRTCGNSPDTVAEPSDPTSANQHGHARST